MAYRIVVVDDESQFLDYIVSILPLEELDLELVLRTVSAREALRTIRRQPVDILLTDVMMGEMSGTQLAQIVHEEKPDVKILALSSYDDYDYVRTILLNGASDYLLKHRIDRASLTSALSKLTDRIRLERFGQAFSAQKEEDLARAITSGDEEALSSLIMELFTPLPDGAARCELLDALIALVDGLKRSEFYIDILVLRRDRLGQLLCEGDLEGFCNALLEAFRLCGISQYYRNDFSKMVKDAIDLIETNWAMNLSLRDTADVLSVNADYLSRQFSKEVGVPFIEYLNGVRLKHARKMLREGQTLKEVAFNCGFKNYSYFLKLFKRMQGLPPGDYQDQWEKVRIVNRK